MAAGCAIPTRRIRRRRWNQVQRFQYVVARALRYGVLRLKDFEGDAHFDPEIVRLLDLTMASPHPDMADDAEHQWGAEVIVTLKDGRRLARRVDNLVAGAAITR